MTKFYASNGFCSHFHNICPSALKLYTEVNDTQEELSSFIYQRPEMLRNINFFCVEVTQKVIPNKKKFLFDAKKSNISKYFWRLVNKRRKILLCIVNLCVKFQCRGTNVVEMRAKTVWRVKFRHFESIFLPPLFLTEKHLYFWSF